MENYSISDRQISEICLRDNISYSTLLLDFSLRSK